MSILPSLHPHADITRGELFYFFRAMPLSSCSLFTLVLLRALKSLQLAIWLQRADLTVSELYIFCIDTVLVNVIVS